MSVGFFDANHKPLKAHEFIGIFTNSFRKAAYTPQKTTGTPYKKKRKGFVSHYPRCERGDTVNTGDRHPTTVLKFRNGNHKSLHPTQKPLDLCEWLVKTYSNEGDLVVDPFAGSGTTLLACLDLNRNAIGCELHEPYVEIAKNRIEKARIEIENSHKITFNM